MDSAIFFMRTVILKLTVVAKVPKILQGEYGDRPALVTR